MGVIDVTLTAGGYIVTERNKRQTVENITAALVPGLAFRGPDIVLVDENGAIYVWNGLEYVQEAGGVGGATQQQIDLSIQQNNVVLQGIIQDARDFALQRANHTGTQPATTVVFAAGENLEQDKVPFLTQGTAPSPDAPNVTAPPTISGTASVGNTLTASPGAVTDGFGGAHTNLWQWVRVDVTNGEVAIAGATNSTFQLTANENGFKIEVKQTPRDSVTGMLGNTRTSALTATVGGTVPANSGGANLPSISPTGSAVAGTVTYNVSAGTWSGSPTSYNYSMRIDGNQVGSSINSASSSITWDPPIAGPFGALTVSVVATNANGPSSPAVSTSSVTVTAPAAAFDWTEMTAGMWAEIVADGSGDPNKSGYEARVNGMPTTGGIDVPPGNLTQATFATDTTYWLDGSYTFNPGGTYITLAGSRKVLVKPGKTATINYSSAASTGDPHWNCTGTNNMVGGSGSGILNHINLKGNGIQFWGGASGGIARHNVFDGGVLVGGGAAICAFYNATNCIIVNNSAKNLTDDGNGGDTDAFNVANNTTAGCNNAVIANYSFRCSDDGVDRWQSNVAQFDSFNNITLCGKHLSGVNGDGNANKYGTGSGAHSSYKATTNDNKQFGFNRNAATTTPRLRLPNSIGDDAGAYAGGAGSYNIISS